MLNNAGMDSRQVEGLMTCNPGGRVSPKLRTASAPSGATYFDKVGISSGPEGHQPSDGLFTNSIVDVARSVVSASREHDDS